MKKKMLAVLMAAAMVGSLGAMTVSAAGEKIALITMDSIDQHWISLNEGAQKAAEELDAMYVLVDDFKSGNAPILYNKETGASLENFDYAVMENGEGIFSVIPEQEINVNELLTSYGWDTSATYHLVATDAFYIPITPEDYDDGEIRGALSGAVNASFPEMTIAMGKISDVIFVEGIVE